MKKREAKKLIQNIAGDCTIYQKSYRKKAGSHFFMARCGQDKFLFIVNRGEVYEQFRGEIFSTGEVLLKKVVLDHDNGKVLRKVFPFTAPQTVGRKKASLGLGDRLGVAAPGHIAAVEDREVMPVLAQQSIRELELTGRSYLEVLDAASWGVFQRGFTGGFGADGDHLKSEAEINRALSAGYSMITLDGSEHIFDAASLDSKTRQKRYQKLRQQHQKLVDLEKEYAGNTFTVGEDFQVEFSREDWEIIALTYFKLLNFAEKIYNSMLKPKIQELDFELSIDETITPTSPQGHFFIGSQLFKRGLEITGLAPRFCGEFQKGIDYRGDRKQFAEEFELHARIADYFGYKLSIHSGSDKFSVYPFIGKYTGGRVHVKTAGTSWLEAIWIIAEYEPVLFRQLYDFAREHFSEATRYYQVSTEAHQVPSLQELSDQQLPKLKKNENVRQLLHITYGVLLQSKEDGKYLFRDRLYEFWNNHEQEYAAALENHIGKHMDKLEG